MIDPVHCNQSPDGSETGGMLNLEALRREYRRGGLRRKDLCDDPFRQFEKWLDQAIESDIKDPIAMTLATVDGNLQPSQRIVLLKQVDSDGLVFFTNYASSKARDIDSNPRVSLHFPWHMLERQIRVCGWAEKVSGAESLRYFVTRPEDSRLAAWASRQSRGIPSRQVLMQQFAAMKRKFQDGKIPLPDFWGGYRVVPDSFEFWQGGEDRLHDRFLYTRAGQDWNIERLAP